LPHHDHQSAGGFPTFESAPTDGLGDRCHRTRRGSSAGSGPTDSSRTPWPRP